MRLMAYNIKNFNDSFNKNNTLKTSAAAKTQLDAVADVIRDTDADLIGITEAPNSGGSQSAVTKLEAFAQQYSLRQSKALLGYNSRGSQDIALLYDPAKVSAVHDPGGSSTSVSAPTFNRDFRVDSDGDGILEIYSHYRPPLEAKVTRNDTDEDFWVIVVHAKSKGIFDNMDRLNFDRTSERNRRKLFAECTSVRQRVDAFLDDKRPTVVMGDINDGPGFDFYEKRFGRSAMEIIMGDLWAPDRILRNYVGRPVWKKRGWTPSSCDFRDPFTGDRVNALIDHIMASEHFKPKGAKPGQVWNPNEVATLSAKKKTYDEASDHYPVTLDIT